MVIIVIGYARTVYCFLSACLLFNFVRLCRSERLSRSLPFFFLLFLTRNDKEQVKNYYDKSIRMISTTNQINNMYIVV